MLPPTPHHRRGKPQCLPEVRKDCAEGIGEAVKDGTKAMLLAMIDTRNAEIAALQKEIEHQSKAYGLLHAEHEKRRQEAERAEMIFVELALLGHDPKILHANAVLRRQYRLLVDQLGVLHKFHKVFITEGL